MDAEDIPKHATDWQLTDWSSFHWSFGIKKKALFGWLEGKHEPVDLCDRGMEPASRTTDSIRTNTQ